MNSVIDRVQNWYLSNCDGDWEHEFGIRIDSLDNPGWWVKIDLRGTGLEHAQFSERSYGVVGEAGIDGNEWLVCKVVDGLFDGAGGPTKLGEILLVFLSWAEELTADKTH
jgi:hypothetical protein